MKSIFLLLCCGIFFTSAHAQNATVLQADPTKKIKIVEASCGECQFKLDGKGCHLAVRIKGKAYFVDGTGLDDHGDAHAADGFCESVRKAEVQGKLINNRFVVTYFKLVTPEPVKNPKPGSGG